MLEPAADCAAGCVLQKLPGRAVVFYDRGQIRLCSGGQAIMGKLIYAITTSLDGFAADPDGNFEWAEPSEEVHAFVNDIVRNVGTSLIGRHMYEIMKVWDEIPTEGTGGAMDGPSEAMNDFAKIWRGAKKIIYSSSLAEVTIANATIERTFDPEAIKKWVAESDQDFDIGGPHLAAQAIKAGAVDEFHQFIAPILIGSGNDWLPKDVNSMLKLVDLRKFDNGFAYLHYRKI
jgi:dihydrofolate reductase